MFWFPAFLLKSQLSVFLLLLWRIICFLPSVCFSDFLLVFEFYCEPRCGFLGIFPVWCSQFLESLALITSISFRKVLTIISSNFCCILFLLSLWTPVTHMLDCHVLCFFILFSVFSLFFFFHSLWASVWIFPAGLFYSSVVINLLSPAIAVFICTCLLCILISLDP